MESFKVTYPCCKFGFEYAFYQRDKNITKWWSVQNMETFDANIVTTLWEEKVQRLSLLSDSVYIYTWLFNMIFGVQFSSGNSAPNSGNNHTLTIPFEGGMYSFKRQGACVFRNRRYQSEPPLKLLPLTWYEKFGTNSIIVKIFVKLQRCTYRAPVYYVTKSWSFVLLNIKYIYSCHKCIGYDKLLKPRQYIEITLCIYMYLYTRLYILIYLAHIGDLNAGLPEVGKFFMPRCFLILPFFNASRLYRSPEH
jgi:hypothetical protein